MKNRIVLLLIGLIQGFTSQAQKVTNKIQADSVRIWQTGGLPAELILENSTRGKHGAFLRNRINGRTEFAYALDSVWLENSLQKFRLGSNVISFNLSGFGSSDTAYRRNDTIYYKKNGIEYNLGTWLTKNTADLVYSALGHNHDDLYPKLTGSYANPSWIISLPWSKITNTPPVDNTTIQTLTDGATITLDYSQGNEGRVTIAGNRTIAITNLPADGKAHYGAIWITQDATGSRTITLPANSKVINGGAGVVNLTKAGGSVDALYFRYNPTTGIFYWTIGKNYN